MAKLILKPQFGTISDSKNVSYEIGGLPALDDGMKYYIEFENTTSSTTVEVIDEDNRVIDLKIPPSASQNAISVFANVYQEDVKGNRSLKEICPSIFYIRNAITKFDGEITVSPVFASPKDVCCINISSSANNKIIFSINDKRMAVNTNDNGIGSVHFTGNDVLDKGDISSIQKFPICFYSSEDNFVKKNFSGSYIHILPQPIAAYVNLDPRCDPGDDAYVAPGQWVAPDICSGVEPEEPEVPIEPGVPAVDIPASCEDNTRISSSSDICGIHTDSVTLLNNGMALHAYTGVDSAILDPGSEFYNINKIYISKNKTSLDVPIIANDDFTIAPKEVNDNFDIYVDEDVYNALLGVDDPSISDIYVLINDRSLGNQSVPVNGRRIDEYTGSYIIEAGVGNTYANIDTWLFCINCIFYHKQEEPERYIDSLPSSLSYVRDADDNVLQVLNVSIASNIKHTSNEEESYVYLIAEALVSGNSQLFFYSFSIGKDGDHLIQSYGWEQLTSVGNNINSKIYMDGTNTLHVLWESDRVGSWQVYYGVLGSSYISVANAVFSSSVDKQAEMLERGNLPVTYLSSSLLVHAVGDEYNLIPEYNTQDIVENQAWNKERENNGVVVDSVASGTLPNLSITANAIDDMAMAFVSIRIAEESRDPSDSEVIPYSQINYQVSFTMDTTLTQPSSLLEDWNHGYLSVEEVDTYYDTWRAGFVLDIDSSRSNVSIYAKDDNSFIIGRQDNIFDRMVPFFGSYEISTSNPSAQNFQINITKDENNLKDFMFGLMLEKSRFKATNSQTVAEYSIVTGSEIGYIPEEEHIIYTGRARLVAFIKTEDTNDERANYYILREFPQVFDITSPGDYVVIANYTRIGSDEVVSLLDKYDATYSDRFIGNLTLLIGGNVKFSQSFISTLSYEEDYFDLGFGIPYGGYCINDKMTPNKIDVFEDVELTFTFENISVSSPTYTFNDGISNLPDTVRDMTSFRVEGYSLDNPSSTSFQDNSFSLLNLGFRGIDETIFYDNENGENGEDFRKTYDVSQINKLTIELSTGSINSRIRVNSEYGTTLYNSGMISTATISGDMISYDVDVTYNDSIIVRVETSSDVASWDLTLYFKISHNSNNFLQVPITMEGINKSANICAGDCDDIHVAWQSNRSKYWDIYYSNAVDKLRPFRFETQITNTNSNSISPSVSVSKNGGRMIVWHDNRNGNFDVYSARSLEGYPCDQSFCENKMVEAYESNVTECSISINFEAESDGYHIFYIEFYNDSGLNDLFETISMSSGIRGWYLNGGDISDVVAYNGEDLLGVSLSAGQEVAISYIPSKEDDIFNRILYTKLNSSIT